MGRWAGAKDRLGAGLVPRLGAQRRTGAIVLGVVLVSITGIAALVAVRGHQAPSAPGGEMRSALLIDQIGLDDPRTGFGEAIAASLAATGVRLEVVPGAEATIRTYRSLPGFGADLLILRTHAALVAKGDRWTDDVALFTSEPIDLDSYAVTGLSVEPTPSGPVGAPARAPTDGGSAIAPRQEPSVGAEPQPAGSGTAPEATTPLSLEELRTLVPVRRFVGDDRRPYFGIGPDFVRDHMDGRLRQGAIVILMGCESMHGRRMSEAFLARGAGAVIGWSGDVSAAHTDAATAELVDRLVRGVPVTQALQQVMRTIGPDPDSGAYLIAAIQ